MLTKLICQDCMATEKVASFTEGIQEGKPCPWNHTATGIERDDDGLWNRGIVHCPHRRTELKFDFALFGKPPCLRLNAHLAAADGALFVCEEVKV